MKKLTLFLFLCSTLVLPGCGGSPSAPTVTTIDCSVSTTAGCTTETFPGNVVQSPDLVNPVFATNFYTVNQAGTAIFTLTSLSIAGAPSTIQVNFGVGSAVGNICSIIGFSAVSARSTPHFAASVSAGTACVSVWDAGNIPAGGSADYSISVVHP